MLKALSDVFARQDIWSLVILAPAAPFSDLPLLFPHHMCTAGLTVLFTWPSSLGRGREQHHSAPLLPVPGECRFTSASEQTSNQINQRWVAIAHFQRKTAQARVLWIQGARIPSRSQFSLFASDRKRNPLTICFVLIFSAGPLIYNTVYYSIYFSGLSKMTKAIHLETSSSPEVGGVPREGLLKSLQFHSSGETTVTVRVRSRQIFLYSWHTR